MFEVEYYETADGRIPVKEFLDSLPKKLRDKAMYSLKLLYEYGNTLREPYSKYLGEGIFELRVKFSSDIIRLFYFFYADKNVVVTNGFIKKTMKLPGGEKRRAIQYKLDYLKRRAYHV